MTSNVETVKLLVRFQRNLKLYAKWAREYPQLHSGDDLKAERIRERLLSDQAMAQEVLGAVIVSNAPERINAWSGLQRLKGGKPAAQTSAALDALIDAVVVKRGELRGSGLVLNTPTQIETTPTVVLLATLRIFVVHDGKTPARDKLADFIRALGAEAVIAESEATKGRGISEKVDAVISSCHYAVAIATKAKAAQQDGKIVARTNVVNELPRIRQAMGNRWMLALETGVALPSNEAASIHESFVPQSMDGVFTALVRELEGHGILTLRPGQ